jgi:hypothetical protein
MQKQKGDEAGCMYKHQSTMCMELRGQVNGEAARGGRMEGVRNKDQKELHAGSANEEGIERQACTERNLFKGGSRLGRYTQTRNKISSRERRSPGQVREDRVGCEISTRFC